MKNKEHSVAGYEKKCCVCGRDFYRRGIPLIGKVIVERHEICSACANKRALPSLVRQLNQKEKS
jgi:hypothetical protein